MLLSLVDTGYANLRSVRRALEEAGKDLGVEVEQTHDPDLIRKADKIVVPGQGGFGQCLAGLRTGGAHEAILEGVRSGKPYLGICLGLQALFESSSESPGVSGLGLFPGTCTRLEPRPDLKIPHMGWNSLELQNGGHPVLDACGGNGSWVYFVHSYHAVPADTSLVKATVSYGPYQITAAVAQDNVVATQFHPEKSQVVGLRLLRGFLEL